MVVAKTPLRVISLLPSATENFSALLEFCQAKRAACAGAAVPPPLPVLVGRSHECDFPATDHVQKLPVLTAARTAFTSSADTHQQVRQALADASSLYHLDAERLVALAPDVILTQSSCKVCSIDLATVESSLLDGTASSEPSPSPSECGIASPTEPLIPAIPGKTARIVTCNPTSLVQVLVNQFQQMGRELGVADEGDAMAQEHLARLQELQHKAQIAAPVAEGSRGGGKKAPRVLMVEWLDPLFIGTIGWMREIIEYAGGEVVESLDGAQARGEGGGDVGQVDVMIVALCGLSLEKTEDEIRNGRVGGWWDELHATQQSRYGRVPDVYFVDGTSMFTRPTRRLLLALEWLVSVLHDPQGEWKANSTFPYKEFAFEPTKEAPAASSTLSPELLEIEELHKAACLKKEAMYKDPATGYSVLTAHFLKERQVCCGNCCRHCPYGHANVKDASRRKNLIAQDVFLNPRSKRRSKAQDAPGGHIVWPQGFAESEGAVEGPRDLVVMFWSGGKDSFLALSHLYANYAARAQKQMPQVVLLTTIDPETNAVPVQKIDVQTIVAQAEALELPLYLVAVGLGGGYAAKVESALKDVPGQVKKEQGIAALAFGDLHLEDIRAWREQAFANDYNLLFPVWKKDYKSELLPALQQLCVQTQARITYSTIDSQELQQQGWQAGMAYKWEDIEALNAKEALGVDLMGESGEFHTCVKFPGME